MNKWLVYGVLTGVALGVVLYLGTYTLKSVSCWSKWGSTSIEYRVSKLSCQVKHPTMGWIPETTFRVTE